VKEKMRSVIEICIFKDKYNKTNSLVHTLRKKERMYITQTRQRHKKREKKRCTWEYFCFCLR